MAEKRKCGCAKPGSVSSIVPDESPTAKICIQTEAAPLPVGPYSQAVKIDKTIYISGCLGLKLDPNELVEGGAAAEAKQALKHMGTILEASGSSYNNVLKTTVFLGCMDDFAAVNDVYKQFFTKDFPARSCFQVAKLPLEANVEIEAIATIVEGEVAAPPADGGGDDAPPPDGDAPPEDAPPEDAPAEDAPAEDAPAEE
ncbi:2-iminobutanoate/2-iminopropanoate deaminase-like [Onthophagus taurus]|uniref:2-iminobutanoate/2-iminopropanoate deaminase-like n=1 Tax=Onthophagus taurus TaxID=166361 RepID=UPI000C20A790|nr:2-iminobutanoate/2-iminopropanoate deaminase-like [Onthophagus taurus]